MIKSSVYRAVSLALTAGILSAGVISCTGNKAKKNRTSFDEAAIKQEIREYTYPLPSAFEVTEMLNKIEAGYIVGLSNDPQKAGNYFTEKDKAVNLGIYAADLAYATTYNQKAAVSDYFRSCEALVRELDFTAAFEQDLPDQIEANLANKDQLVRIVTNMFENAYSYLNQQGRTGLSYLILMGTVVEGLYLTTHLSENTFQDPKIIEAILFQKEPLIKLEKMMQNFSGSELIKQPYRDIRRINTIYAMEEGTSSMTETQVKKLTEVLSSIRNEYVK